ncbi:unnamed protein product [Sympodiomycopsis kandeliae]
MNTHKGSHGRNVGGWQVDNGLVGKFVGNGAAMGELGAANCTLAPQLRLSIACRRMDRQDTGDSGEDRSG